MSDMQRHVLISHAADDPEWTSDQVEAVALAIQQAGIRVSLDLWHQRDAKRQLALFEWRDWIALSINSATHILCLVSTRYVKLWRSKRTVPSGYVVGFESTLLIHHLYMPKLFGVGRILTLRPAGRGYDCIPLDLRLDFTTYAWAADRTMLLSHLAGAPVVSSTRLTDGLFLKGLNYPDRIKAAYAAASAQLPHASATTDGATPAVDYAADIGDISVVLEGHGISTPGVTPQVIEGEQKKTVAAQPKRFIPPSLGNSGMWPAEDAWRAPIGDFPPPWASAWGDDLCGLWADLTVNGVTQRMRWIEPSGPEGFWMMSSQAERDAIDDKDVDRWANIGERVLRREFVDQGFWLADTPCTQSFWSVVVGDNPSHFRDRPDAAERPVENVSWDAVKDQFIARFAQMPDWGTEDRLSLPTEVEWDYAARAGTRTAYWWGDDASRGNADGTGKYNFDDAGTKAVQRSPPNPWGLHDVHGNVWEWCADVWQPYRGAPGVRPDEGFCVVRGGSGFYRPGFARIAYRSRWLRSGADQILGFRFALRSPSGPEARGGGSGR
jgi:sulfatase modifying factor 1